MSEKLTYEERTKFEMFCKDDGAKVICGVDEAGRGPLAGPVVAACVMFDLTRPLPDADDSKKLSEKKRDELYELILSSCVSYGVGIVPASVIDEVNILRATYLAMQAAVSECISDADTLDSSRKLDVLVDHVHIPDLPAGILQRSITHGDALSVSIGAASIIAKVTRDRIMTEMDSVYPGYGFAKHKGYGTKAHYEAIKGNGLCEIHRKSFLKNI